MFLLQRIFHRSKKRPTLKPCPVLGFIRRLLRHNHSYLDQVFTPNCLAETAYIKRETLEQEIITGLNAPGTQVIVCGPSGAGKSNLVYHVLRQSKKKTIISYCTENTTIDSLVADGFSQLPQQYTRSRKK